MDKKEIAKAELNAVQQICSASELNNPWWLLQIQLLRDFVIAAAAEANFKGLGVTPSVRFQRDNKSQRLEKYCKAMLALKANVTKSQGLCADVASERVKNFMVKCSIAQVCMDTLLNDVRLLRSGVQSVIQAAQVKVWEIVSALSPRAMDYDLPTPENHWKLQLAEDKRGDDAAVCFQAATTIATLKEGLIKNDAQLLMQVPWAAS